MTAGRGSKIAQARGGTEQCGAGVAQAPSFWSLTQGRFSRRKWGELGGQEAGDGDGPCGGPQAALPQPLPPGACVEPRAWFSAREARRPLFHTLRQQRPFLVPNP